MANFEIILTSPGCTTRTITAPPRRLSVPTLLKPIPKQTLLPRRKSSLSNPVARPSLFYHLHTLLLFTWSDLKNILIPQTLLAVVTAISCSQPSSPVSAILFRLPHTVIWVWLHLLVFNTSNQSQSSSQLEDLQNKPWRPLPSKRLTHGQARGLFYAVSVLAVILSMCIGGLMESLLLMALYVLNNDLSLGDTNPVTRNLLNAAGYTTFALGAIRTLLHGSGCALSQQGYAWLAFLAAVILTTGQCQDLEDQEGDRAKRRSTIPLVFGDQAARWSVALPMLGWTIGAPRSWDSGFLGSILVFGIGAVVVRRLIAGDQAGYKKTFRLWNCWIIALYILPLCARR
ncbi:MAG: hypothetical protein Q9219_000026 [cf. Caloplaca sp. 3 TL-2023]